MTLAAIIRAQLADGRPLRVTRALLEALEEPPAGVADDLLFGTRTALCEALSLSTSTPGPAIVAAVASVRDEARADREAAEAYRQRVIALERERDEAHARYEPSLTRATEERDEVRARERVTLAVLDEVRIILGVPDGTDVITHARAWLRYHDEARSNARAWAGERDAMRRERDEARAERDALEEDVREHLPEYVLDDGTDDEANERERIVYAGAEIVRLRRERDEAVHAALRREGNADQIERERDEARAEVERLRAEWTAPTDYRDLPGLSAVTASECARLVREAEERGAVWALRWTWDKAGAEIDAIRSAPGYRHPYPTDLEHARVTAFGTMRGHTGCVYPSGSKEVAERICAEARKAGGDE